MQRDRPSPEPIWDPPAEETARDRPQVEPADREAGLVRSWYLPLLAGALPVLLVGFGYSALANRTIFVFWALALAAGWVLLLRHGLATGWATGRRWGTLLLLAAGGLGAFALLERRHHEILDLGFRAFLPSLYTEAATRPATALALAAILGLAGAVALLLPRGDRRAVRVEERA